MDDDHVGVVLASLGTFYGKVREKKLEHSEGESFLFQKELMLSVEESLMDVFQSVNGENEQAVTKQIRQLEGMNLHLERIEVLLPSRF